MTNNKYYTPDISEFYVGFEYEMWSDKTKEFSKYTIKNIQQANVILKQISMRMTNLVRVKYLDKEDIESLGWIFTKEDVDEQFFQINVHEKSFYELIFNIDKDVDWNICIEYWYENLNNKYNFNTVFRGIIKNKSELIKLLKQLNIDV